MSVLKALLAKLKHLNEQIISIIAPNINYCEYFMSLKVRLGKRYLQPPHKSINYPCSAHASTSCQNVDIFFSFCCCFVLHQISKSGVDHKLEPVYLLTLSTPHSMCWPFYTCSQSFWFFPFFPVIPRRFLLCHQSLPMLLKALALNHGIRWACHFEPE